ncbi:GNAT family N-acetyltransferase [Pelagibius sp.]|uniref:GNAT family N-acetyltransferase n=1 Tax=Pelagibius sp. TaxID=1931238 RepID=UPI003B503E76
MPDSIAVTADNHAHYLVRPLRRSDRRLIEQALRLLSARTLYARFHTRRTRLSPREIDYLVSTDDRDHVSWLVLDPVQRAHDGPGGLPIALGRYVRDAENPSRAEVALTVCDHHQGRGVSKVLLGALAASARTAGIESFCGSLLAENHAMRSLMQSLGATLRVQDGTVWAEASADPWHLPDNGTAARIRRVAAQVDAALGAQRRSASMARMRS